MIILRIIIKDITTFKKIANIAKLSLIRLVSYNRSIFSTWSIVDRLLSSIEFDKFCYICNFLKMLLYI